MPAVPYITDDQLAAGAVPAALVAATLSRRGGRLWNLDRVLMHSPPVLTAWNAMLGAIRRELSIDARLVELAVCGVARLNGADYAWAQHAPMFLAAGGTQGQLDALHDAERAHDNAGAFDGTERTVLRLAFEMTRNVIVTDDTRAALREVLPDRQVVEIMTAIAAYNMVSRLVVAAGVELEG